MKNEFHSVSAPLRELMKKYNLEKPYAEFEIKKKWKSILKKQLAEVTVPEKLINKELTIRVTNELWKKELATRKKELLQMINRSLKTVKIDTIKLV